VSLRDGPFQDLKVPLTWTAAIALVVAVVIGIALLLGDRRETLQAQAYGASRSVADTVAHPVGAVLSAPVRWTGHAIAYVEGYFFAVSENRRLHARIVELEQARAVAVALADENARYRALLGLKTEPPIPMVAAHVVTDSRGPFANTRLADAGREQGVVVGNPVMSERGLVGRIVGVAHGISRVLLLTDVASRTPVLIDRTGARAILTGDGGGNPKLSYMRGTDPVKAGDRVLTSGDGGVFPRGLPVGTAVVGLDGTWRVRLDSDNAPIDYVRILLFKDFSQLAAQPELNEAEPPPLAPAEAAALAARLQAAARPAPKTAAPKTAASKTAASSPKPAAPKAVAAAKPAARPAPSAKPRAPAPVQPSATAAP
jgi:rod shape-determining protein MreC